MADAVQKPAPRRGIIGLLTRPLSLRSKPGDVLLALAGAALGVTCALFPWYIFLHQEDFGVRALKFGGGDLTSTAPSGMDPTAAMLMNPLAAPDRRLPQLDLFATGTPRDDKDGPLSAPGLTDQPFPQPPLAYRLVHVENGRAMIEDEVGIYVVQRGSVLPDNSRVSGFQKRGPDWVMITSDERVVEVSP